ncbi:MAG: DNA-3-methyladenine glycosylase 2 family protein [Gammaproteobacteria bacterium]|nr:DNA-3-methyladenine glycosylase 2 family protein [Gammaproteobacteria bacterium]
MPTPSRDYIKRYLIARDKKLTPLIESIAFPTARRNRDIYAVLLRSIISQQLSGKAADTIHARFLQLFPAQYPHPELLRKIPLTRLRRAGLSRQKAGYLKNIAKFSQDDDLSYAVLTRQSDAALIEHLTQIKGVGTWTVEMLLMFSLNRRDVFAVDDLGIQNAMRRLYRIDKQGKALRLTMQSIAERWRPYRTVVCKYLWQWR